MNEGNLRQEIEATCETYDSLYAQLVKPINQMLMELDASILEETAQQIVDNLKAFHAGDKDIADCHWDESQNFMRDGMKLLKEGDLANGALQLFGAGLNFASYAVKAASSKNVHIHSQMNDAFKHIMSELKES
ncbi:hypothetical protein [Paenibacillus aquistagni]|uniref:Uncharacterized protein n=1 Tax=Paenibacillus aquistagni TaxID=1852522 RepID=A0A1X7LGV8_9BACL|nr:hypothetical protein [Paenibacillus aquistagni]SMG53098.1 hypothetical protein SAMN06295960_3441 [Paenibacillus aquistagni]